ncbi:hypothetical protein PPTG_22957 [Phytophthora nicotianae INRA-310]|uniref:Uncharacterized protein n=1 Tax=Phytophthora nicotianae (strain INRA-310) TaxID=761204 RepID=W2Q826_PHYN3|nr:hypothetical protein PPTG_22957 [Phytophthora nicotianae INRA-310]ETN08724.1 hypothetical protein PPTG_22957 [Phytophthora nicotianae INRA-310]
MAMTKANAARRLGRVNVSEGRRVCEVIEDRQEIVKDMQLAERRRTQDETAEESRRSAIFE